MGLIRKYLCGVLSFMLIAASCEKESTNTLPPETQEGKNTFGCFVNNELWVNGNPTFYEPAYKANLKDGKLTIYSLSGKKQSEKNIGITISGLTEANKYLLNNKNNWADYENYVSRCYYSTDSITNTGEVEITKLDKTKKIISGIFQFKAKKSWYPYSNTSGTDCDSFVNITQGRFDLIYSEN